MKIIKPNKKVIVSISGGVDSSVSSAILKEQGYDLIGVFMRFWSEPQAKDYVEVTNKCCTLEAYRDVKELSRILDFPIYSIDYSEFFKQTIVDYFIDSYKKGLTPNPCVQCNKFIKFDKLFELAKKFGAYYVATGHYAQIKKKNGLYHLLRGEDKQKDQTYYLYNLNQEYLSRILFPVGGYKKTYVRQLAKKYNLPMHAKKDSTEICFIPEKSGYQEFLQRHLPMKAGEIKTLDNIVVGKHSGLPKYTKGQRKGLDITNGQGPYFVVKIDMLSNTLYVSNDIKDVYLYSDSINVADLNWISGVTPIVPCECLASIRYGHLAPAVIQSVNNKKLIAKFKQSQRAIMPGQSAVFYHEDELLGGGVIV